MVMTMGWNETQTQTSSMCDVQGMSVTTAKQRLTTKTATQRACSRVLQVFFKSLYTLLGFVLCFVLILWFVSSMVFLSM